MSHFSSNKVLFETFQQSCRLAKAAELNTKRFLLGSLTTLWTLQY